MADDLMGKLKELRGYFEEQKNIDTMTEAIARLSSPKFCEYVTSRTQGAKRG